MIKLGIGIDGELVRFIFNSFDKIIKWEKINKKDLSYEEMRVFSSLIKPTILGYNNVIALSKNNNPIIISTKAKVFVPLTPLHYINFLNRFRENKSFAPVSIDIDITDWCTDQCNFCFSYEYRKTRSDITNNKEFKYKSIPTVSIRQLLYQLKDDGTIHLRFLGGGEPMMHPNFIEIISLAKTLGFIITLYTNGNFLTHQDNAEVIASCVDYLRISVNSCSEESRQIIHRSKSPRFTFKNIILGLEKLDKYIHALNRNNELYIGCSFLIQPENIDEMKKFVDTIASFVNFVSFQMSFGKFVKFFTDEDIIKIKSQVNSIYNANYNSLDIYYSSRFRTMIYENSALLSRHALFSWKYCFEAFCMPIYEANGAIQICSNLRGNDNSELSIGKSYNVVDFINAWHRHTHLKCAYHKEKLLKLYCKDCCSFTVNSTLNTMYELISKNADIEFFVAYDIPKINTNLFQRKY